eukprot:6182626-Pleurochrysis_carterae.AAC.3
MAGPLRKEGCCAPLKAKLAYIAWRRRLIHRPSAFVSELATKKHAYCRGAAVFRPSARVKAPPSRCAGDCRSLPPVPHRSSKRDG